MRDLVYLSSIRNRGTAVQLEQQGRGAGAFSNLRYEKPAELPGGSVAFLVIVAFEAGVMIVPACGFPGIDKYSLGDATLNG